MAILCQRTRSGTLQLYDRRDHVYKGLMHNTLVRKDTLVLVLRAGGREVQGMMGTQRNKMAT